MHHGGRIRIASRGDGDDVRRGVHDGEEGERDEEQDFAPRSRHTLASDVTKRHARTKPQPATAPHRAQTDGDAIKEGIADLGLAPFASRGGGDPSAEGRPPLLVVLLGGSAGFGCSGVIRL